MSEEIRAEIAAHGAVSFERFMELALYGAEGFYVRPDGGSAGRRGDFITSPEVGPLFGAVIARYLDAEWARIGRPDQFTVIDAGAGPGTLARSVLAAAPECRDALRYVAVEISPAQRARHPDGIVSVPELPEPAPSTDGPLTDGPLTDGPLTDGVVIANELLDNLPFRLVVFDNGWREAFVALGSDGRFAEVLSAPFDPVPACLPVSPPFGSRAPLIDRAAAFVAHARGLLRSGSVVAIDYGTPITAMLAGRPWRDWLRTYRGNERGDHYLAAPGTQDITIDVPIDQLPEPDTVRAQAQFLQRWGIDELVDEGRRVWTEQAARPGLEAMKMRSRISEAEALLDPTGLGGFLVAEWRVTSGVRPAM
jgi:SAM-dependent MidA family methyltransferase